MTSPIRVIGEGPGIGHNQSPEPIGPRDELEERVAERIAAANVWARAYIKRDENGVPELGSDGLPILLPITDAQIGTAAEDFLKQLREEWELVEKGRTAERGPLQEQLQAIQDWYKGKHTLIETAAGLVKRVKARYLLYVEEQQRAVAAAKAKAAAEAAAEAKRLAEIAATVPRDAVEAQVAAEAAQQQAGRLAHQASDAAAQKATVTGNYTGRASGFRSTWSAEVTDATAALRHYADLPNIPPKLLKGLQEAADADAKLHKAKLSIPGIQPKETRTV